MEDLIKSVQNLASQEYDRAAIKFGLINHSDHESYSVIKEELEEARDEYTALCSSLQNFWELVKSKDADDVDKHTELSSLLSRAILAACEFIQVAGTAYKAQQTIRNRMSNNIRK